MRGFLYRISLCVVLFPLFLVSPEPETEIYCSMWKSYNHISWIRVQQVTAVRIHEFAMQGNKLLEGGNTGD